MQLTFTPRASRQLLGIIADKGGNLALRITIRGTVHPQWEMLLVPQGPDALLVDGVPVQADAHTRSKLENLVIDWVMTPDGPGFGVYDRNLVQQDYRMAAD